MMYEELKERCRACSQGCNYPSECSYFDKPPLRCMRQLLSEAADAIEELTREYESVSKDLVESVELCRKLKKPKWIPVNERLPDADKRVLCYCRANIYEVMKMQTNGVWVYDTNHVYMHSFVTHWMPLPEPPNEG